MRENYERIICFSNLPALVYYQVQSWLASGRRAGYERTRVRYQLLIRDDFLWMGNWLEQ